MLDAFTANDSLENLLLFTKTIRRDEHGNGLPNRLLRRVSKQPLGPLFHDRMTL